MHNIHDVWSTHIQKILKSKKYNKLSVKNAKFKLTNQDANALGEGALIKKTRKYMNKNIGCNILVIG
jgi:hypothetical protein